MFFFTVSFGFSVIRLVHLSCFIICLIWDENFQYNHFDKREDDNNQNLSTCNESTLLQNFFSQNLVVQLPPPQPSWERRKLFAAVSRINILYDNLHVNIRFDLKANVSVRFEWAGLMRIFCFMKLAIEDDWSCRVQLGQKWPLRSIGPWAMLHVQKLLRNIMSFFCSLSRSAANASNYYLLSKQLVWLAVLVISFHQTAADVMWGTSLTLVVV